MWVAANRGYFLLIGPKEEAIQQEILTAKDASNQYLENELQKFLDEKDLTLQNADVNALMLQFILESKLQIEEYSTRYEQDISANFEQLLADDFEEFFQRKTKTIEVDMTDEITVFLSELLESSDEQ